MPCLHRGPPNQNDSSYNKPPQPLRRGGGAAVGSVDDSPTSKEPKKRRASGSGKACLEITDPEEALLQAAISNDANTIKVLAVMDRQSLQKNIDYALLYGLKASSYDAVKTMLKHGASLKSKDAFGNTVWDYAQQSAEPEMMSGLLQQHKSGNIHASEDIRAVFSGSNPGSRKPSKEQTGQSGQTSSQRTPSTVRRGANSKNSITKLKSRSTL